MSSIIANGRPIAAKLPCSIEEFLVAQNLLPRSVALNYLLPLLPKGGEGWGEEARFISSPSPRPSPLSFLGGEGGARGCLVAPSSSFSLFSDGTS